MLAAFVEAGVVSRGDVATTQRLCDLAGEQDESVALALALTIRALRHGSICILPATVRDDPFEVDEARVDVAGLPWPDPSRWQEALTDSVLVHVGEEANDTRPLRLAGGRLYLERYWRYQESIRAGIAHRRMTVIAPSDPAAWRESIAGLFPDEGPDRQRDAAMIGSIAGFTVIAGGPGTGKTRTVARLLAASRAATGREPRIALAAPTGKAAARMTESLHAQLAELPADDQAALSGITATTIHALLGWAGQTRFRHDVQRPLPHDLVVVDEASMVSLMMMARLMEALGPATRLVLVGDPGQLASVEAGAVLADIVAADLSPVPATAELAGVPTTGVVELVRNFRFTAGIADVAAAIRSGDADAAVMLLREGRGGLTWIEAADDTPGSFAVDDLRDRVVEQTREVLSRAAAGDAAGALTALDEHRVLCGHRRGVFGVAHWNHEAEKWLAQAGVPIAGGGWYVGRPLLVTRNQRATGVSNGDTGVIVHTPDGDRAAFQIGTAIHTYSAAEVSDLATVFAMTVHKSQGSQFGHVSLILPPPGSPLLTRQLLYTAITRAERGVSVLGTERALREAIASLAQRASGLAQGW